jgi:hypothetical protein
VNTVIHIHTFSHPDPERLARRRARLLAEPNRTPFFAPAVSGRAVAEAMASKPRATPMPQQRSLPDAATTIGIALHWSRRRGRRLSALPDLIRRQLEQLCEAGDPAARLVRNWLVGHGPFDRNHMSGGQTASDGGVEHAG